MEKSSDWREGPLIGRKMKQQGWTQEEKAIPWVYPQNPLLECETPMEQAIYRDSDMIS